MTQKLLGKIVLGMLGYSALQRRFEKDSERRGRAPLNFQNFKWFNRPPLHIIY